MHRLIPKSETIHQNMRILGWSATVVLTWRLALEFINQVIIDTLPRQDTITPSLDRWALWDGGWYRGILESGYFYDPTISSSIAFFPVFPMLVKFISLISPFSYLVSGLILNTVLTVGSVFFIYKSTLWIANKTGNQRQANRAATIASILFLLFPSSLFLAAFYADAVLIFGITAAIYLSLTQRIWAAAIFAGLASASKSIGAVAAPTILLINYLVNSNQNFDFHYLRKSLIKYIGVGAIALSGLLSYMLYLALVFNDALAFIHTQTTWGRSQGDFFISSLWSNHYSKVLDVAYFGGAYNYLISLLAMFTPFVFLALGIIFARKKELVWIIPLILLVALIPLSTGIVTSVNRYMYCVTPVFSLFGIYLAKHKSNLPLIVIVTIGVLLLSYISMGFLQFKLFAG